MKKSLLREALKFAYDNIDAHPQHNFYMHWSFIIQRNKLMGYGTNDAGSAPIHLGFQARLKDAYPAKRHSEWNCWRRVKGIIIPKVDFEIINVRLNRRGQIKNSQPCNCCFNFLKELDGGCKCCYFTTDSGLWAKTIF